jgi:hypothetical protein
VDQGQSQQACRNEDEEQPSGRRHAARIAVGGVAGQGDVRVRRHREQEREDGQVGAGDEEEEDHEAAETPQTPEEAGEPMFLLLRWGLDPTCRRIG